MNVISFRPERALSRPGGVNLRLCLCGVQSYTSAQSLDFLARTKNPRFPIRKRRVPHPEFPDGNLLSKTSKGQADCLAGIADTITIAQINRQNFSLQNHKILFIGY